MYITIKYLTENKFDVVLKDSKDVVVKSYENVTPENLKSVLDSLRKLIKTFLTKQRT